MIWCLKIEKPKTGSSLVAQQIKGLALSMLWHRWEISAWECPHVVSEGKNNQPSQTKNKTNAPPTALMLRNWFIQKNTQHLESTELYATLEEWQSQTSWWRKEDRNQAIQSSMWKPRHWRRTEAFGTVNSQPKFNEGVKSHGLHCLWWVNFPPMQLQWC